MPNYNDSVQSNQDDIIVTKSHLHSDRWYVWYNGMSEAIAQIVIKDGGITITLREKRIIPRS